MIQAELRIASGNKQGNSIPLPVGKFLVGREEDCHLRPNSDLVSRHHCVFTVDEFQIRLRDLGSTNGTLVNGERLKGAVTLQAGDRVLIGKLDFEVVILEGATVAAPVQSSLETVMIAGSPEAASASTQFSLPAFNPAAPVSAGTEIGFSMPQPEPVAATPTMVPTGDTQYMPQPMPMMPGYGMPQGYPQQPQYMPYGYPGYPQMQMPQMQMPYPQMQQMPMGYPQMQMQMPMGQMMPGYGMPPQPAPQEEDSDTSSASSLAVKLPDPDATGAKAPPPPAPPPPTGAAAGTTHIPTAAADIIKQYMNRR